MPLMNGDSRRSGSPVAWNVGQPFEQPTEHHLDLLAGQMRAQAEVGAGRTEPDVGIRGAPHVEGVRVLEHVFVPVRRVVEHDDSVAGHHLLASEDRVLRHRPPHPDDRRGPAHDLVHRGRRHGGRIGLPQGSLIGMLGEGQQPMADGVAGGLVAGHHQQNEERRHLGIGQRLAIDVGVDQRGGHILGGVLLSVLGQIVHQHVELLRRHHEGDHGILALGDVFGVSVREDHVGGVEHGVVVGRARYPSCCR